MFHVEFLGPSGVGKTTLRAAVGDRIPGTIHGNQGRFECLRRAHGYGRPVWGLPGPIADRLLNLYWSCHQREEQMRRCLGEHPRIGAQLTELLLAVGADTGIVESIDPDSLQAHVHEEMSIYQLYSTYTDDQELVLIDDGLFQFFLFLLMEDPSYEPTKLIRALPCPDVLVVVDAPTNVCFERQESRARGRIGPLEELDTQRVKTFIKRMRTAVDQLSDTSRQHGIHTIRVNNTEGLDSTVDTIVDTLTANRPM